jgi:glutathione S-transferase
MLQLYFRPMACSLASRIALMEAGIGARYVSVDIRKKTIRGDGGDFWAVTSKGAVPALVLDDGEVLTENAAVLQYIADLQPESGLAPPAGTRDRYRLQEWLSFVSSEIHKAYLFPVFWYADEAAKTSARERINRTVSVAAAHLERRPHLVGDRFTVADAYLVWALLLLRYGKVDLAQWPALVEYLGRMQQRAAVGEAIAIEQEMLKTTPFGGAKT